MKILNYHYWPLRHTWYWHTCQVSRFRRESHASRHQITLDHAHPHNILTLTQKSTNLKISVKILKLAKQYWFAQYGNNQWRLQALKPTCYVWLVIGNYRAHQDEAAIKRRILTKTHKDKHSPLRQQPTINIVPQNDPLTFKTSRAEVLVTNFIDENHFPIAVLYLTNMTHCSEICSQIRKLQNSINVLRLKLFA